MPWTIPDKGEGDNDLQSILFQEYLEVLVAGISGTDCVLSGCAITGGPDMTPAVAKGAVLSNGVLFAVSAGDVTIGAADTTNPRIDLIVADSTGAKQVRAGTAAANPKPAARSANDVVLGAVYVPANDTSIETSKVVDMRVVRSQGPITIYKATAARTVNNTAAEFSAFAAAPSIPSGLFLSGKTLRLRLGGNMLINSGTPTVTLRVKYGATTMFNDVTVVGAIDTDRRAWRVEFDLVAQANNDQSLNGWFVCLVGATTAAAAGLGDIGSDETSAFSAISGSAAVDSDAGNNVFDVTFQMNVANTANEIVIEYATLEFV